jgi:uncharacterized lipoprotein YmbA
MKGWRRPGLFPAGVTIAILLSACSPAGPPPELYVLGDAARPGPEPASPLDDPIVEVKPVRVPDYLDTTDIFTRESGGRIVASRSARWGERLSVGVTRAVATSLEARLPRLVVTTSPPLEHPRWQVLIDLDAFEVQPGGLSVLTARWSIRDGRGGQKLREERISLSAPIDRGNDQEVVKTMTRQVGQLVGCIAPALQTVSLADATQ